MKNKKIMNKKNLIDIIKTNMNKKVKTDIYRDNFKVCSISFELRNLKKVVEFLRKNYKITGTIGRMVIGVDGSKTTMIIWK